MTLILELGEKFEDEALEWLRLHGFVFHVVAHRYRTKQGEIDWILEMEGDLVFLEIRGRQVGGGISPEETVTLGKRRRIERTAGAFLSHYSGKKSVSGIRFSLMTYQAGQWIYYPEAY